MPPWSTMKKKFAMEVSDLPQGHAPNVVVIEGLETEEGVDQMGQPFTRHLVFLAGWQYPLRLNNAAIDVLQSLYGPNTEDSIGKKIALIASAQSSFGKTEMRLAIHPYAPGPEARPVPVPSHLFTKSAHRAEIARSYAVSMASATFGNKPPTPQLTNSRLGDDAAAELLLLLRERNRDWGWLIRHLEGTGITGLGDRLPPEIDASIKAPAWAVIKSLPVVSQITDRPAEKAKLISNWVLASKAPPGVDPKTGEVMDDIPF